jgi:hypothetical protein
MRAPWRNRAPSPPCTGGSRVDDRARPTDGARNHPTNAPLASVDAVHMWPSEIRTRRSISDRVEEWPPLMNRMTARSRSNSTRPSASPSDTGRSLRRSVSIRSLTPPVCVHGHGGLVQDGPLLGAAACRHVQPGRRELDVRWRPTRRGATRSPVGVSVIRAVLGRRRGAERGGRQQWCGRPTGVSPAAATAGGWPKRHGRDADRLVRHVAKRSLARVPRGT